MSFAPGSARVRPKGVQLFEEAGATPALGIYDVVLRRGH